MIKNLLTLLRKLKNLFINNIKDLKTIKEKNNILEIKSVEEDLKTLQFAKKSCEPVAFYLTYHQQAIIKYYPTLINEDTKLLFENKSLILKEHVIKFNKIMILLKKLEFRCNQKLEKLRAKENIEDNYELTQEFSEEFALFAVIFKELDYKHIKSDFYDTLKILNIDIT